MRGKHSALGHDFAVPALSSSSSVLTVVGGGLSGCTLALRALERGYRGYRVRLIDPGNAAAASRAAAGVINPITGMRFSRSWRVDEFLPVAISFYQNCEARSGRKLWHPMPVCRLFRSPELRDGFFKRRSLEQLAPYAKRMVEAGEDVGPVENRYGGVWIEGGGWVDLAAFLDVARELISESESGEWVESEADLQQECEREDALVVDCRGYCPDPELWGELPWKPAHGDILTLESNAEIEGRILNRAQFILPQGGGRFRFGATYEWEPEQAGPTEAGKASLLESFAEWVNIEGAEVVGQQAGIRPIIRDQKPVLGKHPQIKNLNIFNGMGSKGGLWAPFLADTLLDHLLAGRELDRELDVARFAVS
jgi:glycine/D-amino acid oxidase-like deaminating enzyme